MAPNGVLTAHHKKENTVAIIFDTTAARINTNNTIPIILKLSISNTYNTKKGYINQQKSRTSHGKRSPAQRTNEPTKRLN